MTMMAGPETGRAGQSENRVTTQRQNAGAV
jgi:hypothetical protein